MCHDGNDATYEQFHYDGNNDNARTMIALL